MSSSNGTNGNNNDFSFTIIDRAVVYGRVSYDDRVNDSRNLESQLEMGREYALEKNYRIVAELAEDERGVSGAEIDLPKLNRVLELAANGQFDVLVVRELDRLSRSLGKQLVVESELKRAGVRVEYVLAEYEETPEGRLNKLVRATVAEYEREKIRERLVRGRRNKVKAGNVAVGGYAPYGYQVAEIDGKRTLEICEREAYYVRMIFEMYRDGHSLRAIADRMDELGAPLPRTIKKKQKGWLHGTIRHVLKNETHAGTWHYGKRNPRRKTQQANPEDNRIAVPVPATIDQELFDAVQAKLQSNKRDSRRNLKAPIPL
jgi:site-specific DNA recombinase